MCYVRCAFQSRFCKKKLDSALFCSPFGLFCPNYALCLPVYIAKRFDLYAYPANIYDTTWKIKIKILYKMTVHSLVLYKVVIRTYCGTDRHSKLGGSEAENRMEICDGYTPRMFDPYAAAVCTRNRNRQQHEKGTHCWPELALQTPGPNAPKSNHNTSQ